MKIVIRTILTLFLLGCTENSLQQESSKKPPAPNINDVESRPPTAPSI